MTTRYTFRLCIHTPLPNTCGPLNTYKIISVGIFVHFQSIDSNCSWFELDYVQQELMHVISGASRDGTKWLHITRCKPHNEFVAKKGKHRFIIIKLFKTETGRYWSILFYWKEPLQIIPYNYEYLSTYRKTGPWHLIWFGQKWHILTRFTSFVPADASSWARTLMPSYQKYVDVMPIAYVGHKSQLDK